MYYDKEKQQFILEESDKVQTSGSNSNQNDDLFDSDMMAIFGHKPNEEVIPEESVEDAVDSTMVLASEKTLGSGLGGEAVIDRAEWDKIVAQVDAEQNESELEEDENSEENEEENNSEMEEQGKKKKGKKSKKDKSKKRKVWKWIIISFLSLCLIACVGVAIWASNVIKDTPEINPDNLYDLLSEHSVILDKNGDLIANIYEGGELRTNIDYNDIPEDLVWALVCTEDKTFFTHNGFNLIRIAGSIWDTVKSGFTKKVSGTSTITQQLARNIYLEDIKGERSLSRKLKEAYYTVVLEKSLSKEQILEAYMNTIYLGFNSNGVQAAAQAYFGKDVKDLSLIECACLASLPQSPVKFAPLKRLNASDVEDDSDYDIVCKTDEYVTIYNGAIEDRIWLILYNMVQQGHLSQTTFDSIKDNIYDLLRVCMNPAQTIEEADDQTTYFKDYVISTVVKDIQENLGKTYDEAYDMLYTGGLIINTTLDPKVQTILDETYADDNNFFKLSLNKNYVAMDRAKNILYPENKNKIMYYLKSNMFTMEKMETKDKDGNTIEEEVPVYYLSKDEYKYLDNGDLMIYWGNRLYIYYTKVGETVDYSLEFKSFYEWKDGQVYTTEGGYILIPAEYKTRDDDKNLTISAKFFEDYPDIFTVQKDGTIRIDPSIYKLQTSIIQPQSAFCIIENATGQIRGMVGGRKLEGSKLYNRVISQRQTGSSIKPLAIYGPTLQLGYENAKYNAKNGSDVDGNLLPVYTPATPIDDIPTEVNGVLWPSNFAKYFGRTTLRRAVQESLNASAVSLFFNALDTDRIISTLQALGISTIQTGGEMNDVNPAALALGGQTNGVSPLEMCAAYAAIGNHGVYNTPTCYSSITNKKGEVILTPKVETRKVFDEDVASSLIDVLQTVVSESLKGAKLSTQASAGKSGTTTSNYDLWFCGLTPKYAANVWLGCDNNIYLNGTSSANATKVWKAVMEKVGALDAKQDFQWVGSSGYVERLIDSRTGLLAVTEDEDESKITPEEYCVVERFIKGTEPTEYSLDVTVKVLVCSETGYLATPECVEKGCVAWKTCIQRVSGASWESLLASYNITKKDFDKYVAGDSSSSVYRMSKEEQLAFKASYLGLIEDAKYDIPEYYCPLHNPNPDDYVISPFADLVEYNTEGLEPIEEDPEDPFQPDNPDNPENPGDIDDGGDSGREDGNLNN